MSRTFNLKRHYTAEPKAPIRILPIRPSKDILKPLAGDLPKQLLLQRLDPATGTYGIVNALDVHPYTEEGVEATKAELTEQQWSWEHNYPAFFGSTWRIHPVYP